MEEALAHSKAFWTALARDDWHASHSVLSRRGLTTLTLEEYVTEKWPERLRYELERELCDLRIEGSEARLIYAALSTFTPTGCAIGPNYHGPGTFRLPRVLEERWVRAGEGWELAYWGPPPEDLDPPCDPTALLTALER